MRATWRGARSGRMAIVTGPRVVSRIITSSLSGVMRPRLLALLRVGSDLHMHDAVGVAHGAVVRLATLLDLVDRGHAGHDLADHGVLAVEAGRLVEHDKELRVGGVRAGCARHADDAALERHVGKLGRQVGIFGAAGAVAALTVAGLRHE